MLDLKSGAREVDGIKKLIRLGDYRDFNNRCGHCFLTREKELQTLEELFREAMHEVEKFIQENEVSFGEAVVHACQFGVLTSVEHEQLPSETCLKSLYAEFEDKLKKR